MAHQSINNRSTFSVTLMVHVFIDRFHNISKYHKSNTVEPCFLLKNTYTDTYDPYSTSTELVVFSPYWSTEKKHAAMPHSNHYMAAGH